MTARLPRRRFEDRQIAVGATAFECAAHAAQAFPEMWKDADRAQYARRQHGRGQPAGTITWQYRIAGQGERSWRVYAPAAHDRRRGAAHPRHAATNSCMD